jgi:hypothetical protein
MLIAVELHIEKDFRLMNNHGVAVSHAQVDDFSKTYPLALPDECLTRFGDF